MKVDSRSYHSSLTPLSPLTLTASSYGREEKRKEELIFPLDKGELEGVKYCELQITEYPK